MVRIKHFATALVLVAVGIAVPAPLAAAATGVDPGSVELTLAPGASSAFAANVTTPTVAPNPDIVFLADTTGSMDPALANVRNNLRSIMADVRAAQPNARFAVAAYKEQADGDRVFRVNTPLTSDEEMVVAGAQEWLYDVGGGGQPQTDFLNAHYRIATGAVAFRPQGTRVIAWFGDARSNDPSLGHTLADTVNALRANGIRVVAVPVTGTTAPGLDERGQATSITNGTDGVLMPGQGAGEVATAILNGVQALTVTVAAVPSCAPQLTLTTDPTTRTVRGGTTASFTETVSVRPDAAAGTYQCAVDFQVNGLSVGYTQTVTVHVPGTQPALRISDVTVDEGDSGTTPATLTVSLDRAATQPVTVGWATVPGTAGNDDFGTGSGTLTFAPGETSKQVTVGVVGDQVDEPDETFTVRLSNPTGAIVDDADGVVTVRDDDEPNTLPLLRISDTTVPEADADTTGSLTVSLDHAATEPVTVDWATAPGTAGDGDFRAGSGTLTFAPGQTSAPLPVTVIGDDLVEQDETFTVHLSNAAGATVDDADGVVTITDEDGDIEPGVRIGDAAGPEGNVGTTPATLTVTLDRSSTTPVPVQWTTAPDTAGADDFVAASGELVFAPGEVSKQVTVQLRGDLVQEGRETFLVRLTGAGVVDDTGFVTVEDDDTGTPPGEVPALRIGDVTVPEGNASASPATVTVVLDQVSATPVTVRWATQDGTATAPGDYTAGSDVLTFAPGVTSQQITVPVAGDQSFEQAETFGITLSEPAGATVVDGSAVVTVGNDDVETGPSEVTVNDVSVVENAGPAVLTVRLSAARDEPLTVGLATRPDSATAPADYTAIDTTVTFAPGETQVPVPVEIVDDTSVEGVETFMVEVSGGPSGVVTIVDDETATPGTFSCTASAAELLGTRPAVANPAGTPCVDDTRTAARARLGLGLLTVRVDGLTAGTDAAPGGMSATAGLVTTRISTIGLVVEIGAVTSSASVSCVAGPGGLTPVFSGSSSIASLTVNGVAMPIGSGPVTVPLLVGSLTLNSTVASPDGLTQRAFDFRTVLGRVVIGESSVGVTGNPCR